MCIGTLKNWLDSSYLAKNNQYYIEQIYKDFLKNPDSIDPSWIKIFQRLSFNKNHKDKSFTNVMSDTYLQPKNKDTHNNTITYTQTNTHEDITSAQILQLINSFRIYGHQYAKLDPLNLHNKISKNYLLELKHYSCIMQNIQKKVNTIPFDINIESMTPLEIYEFLKKIYCGSIGIEYMHILDVNTMLWLQNNFEATAGTFTFSSEEKKQLLKEIVAAEGIERYLGVKFPGVKRFSLEGGDALIPMLKEIIRYSVTHHNIKEIFLGMAHRGRLNVLINVLGKNPQDLFNEFFDKHHVASGSGDVKYHQGFYSDITINGHNIHLSLLYNPSHLEIVSPIVMGSARARIDQLSQKAAYSDNLATESANVVLPIIIHGDAAISAQGIVQETFNMSKTRAYDVGGSIHIIINNQVGFTTSNIRDMRSTQYCTDIAKMIQAPIFHVNADDIEAVIYVTRIALNFRNIFKRDVLIDLVCYRRHGHNEADEPSVTQPTMYKKIRKHPTLLNIYTDQLNKSGIIATNDNSEPNSIYREKLEKEFCVLQQWQPIRIRNSLQVNNLNKNKSYLNNINDQYLKNLAYCINNIPSNITMHSRVQKIYYERMEMALGNKLFDWGAAEMLAYATLLDQGISIRLSGEDVARGTFFHRHAIIYDQNSEIKYIPLHHINEKENEKKGYFYIWDSVLSEEAALAFEYGYANLARNMLVIWEAQFGDFSNGAQIVIDQFISSGEQKWGQLCGLVMFLPHGYEGQGPEHSSSRVERYLQLCAEYNMCICIPSTPGQLYHILRKQATCNIKKPLIIITPKSLLRHAMVTDSLNNLISGSFNTVFKEIDDNITLNQVIRVIMCTGKIYYDLLSQRRKNNQYNIAIIRIEQLYPFPYIDIQTILFSYSHVKDFVWCQEEPKNQGAWYHIQTCLLNNDIIPKNIKLNYIGRPDSAAPAVGYLSIHQKQQKKLIDDALNIN